MQYVYKLIFSHTPAHFQIDGVIEFEFPTLDKKLLEKEVDEILKDRRLVCNVKLYRIGERIL